VLFIKHTADQIKRNERKRKIYRIWGEGEENLKEAGGLENLSLYGRIILNQMSRK